VVLIDGIEISGQELNNYPLAIPPLDSVAEFRVQTSNYSVEFGRQRNWIEELGIKGPRRYASGKGKRAKSRFGSATRWMEVSRPDSEDGKLPATIAETLER
jgi:hypothetical protein